MEKYVKLVCNFFGIYSDVAIGVITGLIGFCLLAVLVLIVIFVIIAIIAMITSANGAITRGSFRIHEDPERWREHVMRRRDKLGRDK